jgi:hypothetical protein
MVMGVRYLFKCEDCELSAEVCGGSGAGMHFECVTIWCNACKKLSDATAKAEFSTDAVVVPVMPCPQCGRDALSPWAAGTCPRCGSKMDLEPLGGDAGPWDMKYVCHQCDYETLIWKDPKVEPDDTVHQGVICTNCEDIVHVTSRQPGIWNHYNSWTDVEIRCSRCESSNVTRWSSGENCPSCGGAVRQSRDPAEFFD